MKLTIALISLLLALSVTPVFAQFGSGIVYDPTNYHNAVLRYLQLQKQLQQDGHDFNKGLFNAKNARRGLTFGFSVGMN